MLLGKMKVPIRFFGNSIWFYCRKQIAGVRNLKHCMFLRLGMLFHKKSKLLCRFYEVTAWVKMRRVLACYSIKKFLEKFFYGINIMCDNSLSFFTVDVDLAAGKNILSS